MVPELVITRRTYLFPKRLKKYLREHPPVNVFCISRRFGNRDFYMVRSLPSSKWTRLIFWRLLARKQTPDYPVAMENYCKDIPLPQFPYSKCRPLETSSVPFCLCNVRCILANSSVIRYAQLFPVSNSIECVVTAEQNGIEGSLSTAIGYAVALGEAKLYRYRGP